MVMPGELGVTTLGLMSHDLPSDWSYHTNPPQCGWHHISHPEKWVVMPGELGVTTLGLMSHDLPSDWSYHINPPQSGWHHISHPEKWVVMPYIIRSRYAEIDVLRPSQRLVWK